jgi:phosphohistidine phosphatase
MNLYLLRHGIAVEPGTAGYESDSDRPLTAKGEARLREAARAMKELGLSSDLILSSPYLRAKQTAEIIAKSLKLKRRLTFSDELTPDGSPSVLIQQLNKLKPVPENVLLVGHEPYLSRFISRLTTGNTGAALDLKKGGLCKLEVESLHYGCCAKLMWLLTPDQMKLMV